MYQYFSRNTIIYIPNMLITNSCPSRVYFQARFHSNSSFSAENSVQEEHGKHERKNEFCSKHPISFSFLQPSAKRLGRGSYLFIHPTARLGSAQGTTREQAQPAAYGR